jgi:hypothetical protein
MLASVALRTSIGSPSQVRPVQLQQIERIEEGFRLVTAVAGDQPDADRIAPCHKPVAVVLDLVNPVRAGRGLVGGGRETGPDEFGVGGKPFTHKLDQHAANLVSRSQ